MPNWIDYVLSKIGIKEGGSTAIQFVIGVGLVAISLNKYSPENQILSVIGILFGGYLILKSVQWKNWILQLKRIY